MLKHLQIFVDSCAFWPPDEKEKKAISELLKFEEDNLIQLTIPSSVEKELQHAPCSMKRHRFNRFISLPLISNDEEIKRKQDIQTLLFGERTNLKNNESRDVMHIFIAHKYGCQYFVTFDRKHLLAKKKLLNDKFSIQIVTPSECLEIVIKEYDNMKKHKGNSY